MPVTARPPVSYPRMCQKTLIMDLGLTVSQAASGPAGASDAFRRSSDALGVWDRAPRGGGGRVVLTELASSHHVPAGTREAPHSTTARGSKLATNELTLGVVNRTGRRGRAVAGGQAPAQLALCLRQAQLIRVEQLAERLREQRTLLLREPDVTLLDGATNGLSSDLD